jgi:predicted nucleotidyltransferase
MPESRIVLLRGVVGSQAYGLAREGSDTDRLGVFAWRTDAFWHLDGFIMQETFVQHEPYDMQEHELQKYLLLALKCNPTVMELLWLPKANYKVRTRLGSELIALRKAFLSTKYVRSAYGGYAKQQAERLRQRHAEGKEGFSSDTKKRTAKHARHCFRLLEQGRQLMETGSLDVRVKDPQSYWAFDDMAVRDILGRFEEADAEFQAAESVLPDAPDFARVDMFLYRARRSLL